jgi:site-specific DNA-methyltransferase (adenine-specific)
MNPPYGRAIGEWMRKAWLESQRGALVVSLVPARTDTIWWHDYAMRGEIRYVRGRLRFNGHTNPAPFSSVVVVFKAYGLHKNIAIQA